MAIASKVAPTTFTTPSDRELTATKVVDAPRQRVWEAFTRPKYVQQWLLAPDGSPMEICEMDVRPAGAWHWGWRERDGSLMEMRGLFREILPSERLVQTVSQGGDWPETLNTMTLSERNGKTTIQTTVLYPSREAREKALGTGMKEGWGAAYDRLDEFLPKID
jgi:uncharacterized protein YndB with AHSA1/START domain